MSTIDELVRNADSYSESFEKGDLPLPPAKRVAIVACMDARLDVEAVLGLRPGEAHIIRNAGGLATEDAVRSLIVSQQLLGTDRIVVIGHTGCGLLNADEDALRERLTAATGKTFDMRFGSFDDLEATIRITVEHLQAHPWLKRVPVHGLAFDVATGRLHEVD